MSVTERDGTPFSLSPPKRKTNAARHAVCSRRSGERLDSFPFYSLLFLATAGSLRPFVAVGVKKSSRRLVSCQNNTSRHRERETPVRLSVSHSVVTAAVPLLPPPAGSPKHHLGRQGKREGLAWNRDNHRHFPSFTSLKVPLSQNWNHCPTLRRGPHFAYFSE